MRGIIFNVLMFQFAMLYKYECNGKSHYTSMAAIRKAFMQVWLNGKRLHTCMTAMEKAFIQVKPQWEKPSYKYECNGKNVHTNMTEIVKLS